MKELEKSELMKVDGGNRPAATYLTAEQITAAGDAIIYCGAFAWGFLLGFFGF